jgi:hypothetical protein
MSLKGGNASVFFLLHQKIASYVREFASYVREMASYDEEIALCDEEMESV